MRIRHLSVDPSDSTPIWSQVEEGIRRLVACAALPPGEAVPSVRDLARDLSVNPATVAKAYQRLVEAGVLTVRRGEGTYVSQEPPALTRTERSKQLKAAATRYASFAATIGSDADEAALELASAWRQLIRARGDKA